MQMGKCAINLPLIDSDTASVVKGNHTNGYSSIWQEECQDDFGAIFYNR